MSNFGLVSTFFQTRNECEKLKRENEELQVKLNKIKDIVENYVNLPGGSYIAVPSEVWHEIYQVVK